jgi:hypothetical protein
MYNYKFILELLSQVVARPPNFFFYLLWSDVSRTTSSRSDAN